MTLTHLAPGRYARKEEQKSSKDFIGSGLSIYFVYILYLFRALFTAHRQTLTDACVRPWLVHDGMLEFRFMVACGDRRRRIKTRAKKQTDESDDDAAGRRRDVLCVSKFLCWVSILDSVGRYLLPRMLFL